MPIPSAIACLWIFSEALTWTCETSSPTWP